MPDSHLTSPSGASKGEKIFASLVLLVSTGAFMNLTVTGRIEGQNMGMIGMQVLWAGIYLLTIVLFLRGCDHTARHLLSVWPLVAMVAFAGASILWSEDPSLTLRRSVAVGLTLVFGVYFATRFGFEEQLRLLAWAYAVCIFFSFFFELLGLNPSEGMSGWYGVFFQKNELGRNMALSALIFLFLGRADPSRKKLTRVGFLASIALIALSRSMTAVLAFGLVLSLLPYLRWTLQKSMAWAAGGIVLLLGIGGAVLIYVATHMEQVTGFLGRSATLSGRLELWILSVLMALRRPWLGYGFNAFWLPGRWYVQRIWQLLHWQPPHAHNGFLELWLELGFIGLGLFILVFIYYSAKALQFMRRDPTGASAWPLIFLLFMLVENLTETAFLSSNSIYLILYVAVAATVCGRPSESLAGSRLPVPEQHYA